MFTDLVDRRGRSFNLGTPCQYAEDKLVQALKGTAATDHATAILGVKRTLQGIAAQLRGGSGPDVQLVDEGLRKLGHATRL
jgi:hypothetical protein